MATRKEATISEQQAQEIVERMSRRESRDRTFLNDFYKRIGLEPDKPEHADVPNTSEAETAMTEETAEEAANEMLKESASDMPGKAAIPQKRISSKQRRLSLEEYRTTYLQVPKIADRKPVFVSGRGARQFGQDSPLLRRQGHERIGNGREPRPPAPRNLP